MSTATAARPVRHGPRWGTATWPAIGTSVRVLVTEAGRLGDAVEVVATQLERLDRAVVWRWTATLPGRGACRHPDGAARLIASALRVFAADLSAHVAGRPCAGWYAGRILEVPR